MNPPEGYKPPGNEQKIWKLTKAIYGLKQAAREWHLKFIESLENMNFIQSTSDPCLYKSRKEKNRYIHYCVC